VGDPKEAEGISSAFFPSLEFPEIGKSENDKIYVGSIKTVIGNSSPSLSRRDLWSLELSRSEHE
jgi:hypothetical protein